MWTSSGSDAGVAAGFAPVAIGTESDGSLVQRSTQAAFYGIKRTLGSIPTDGIQPISAAFDFVGGMAKTPQDLADVISILHNGHDYFEALVTAWDGLKVSFVDPNLWQLADFVVGPDEDFKQQTVRTSLDSYFYHLLTNAVSNLEEMDKALEKISNAGAHAVHQVFLKNLSDIEEEGGSSIYRLWGDYTQISASTQCQRLILIYTHRP